VLARLEASQAAMRALFVPMLGRAGTVVEVREDVDPGVLVALDGERAGYWFRTGELEAAS
jgi:hypothetical protein